VTITTVSQDVVFGTWEAQNHQTPNKVCSERSWTAHANFCLKLFDGHIHFSWNNYWWAMRHRLIGVVLKWSNNLYSGTEEEVKLTTQLRLLMMWGMSGTIPILPPYAFMSCMGTTSLEQFIIEKRSTWIPHTIGKKT